MEKITFQGAFWNQLRLSQQCFSPGEDIVDPSNRVTFSITGGLMRVTQSAGRNVLFFANQSCGGTVLGTAALVARFNGFLSRHVHLTAAGSDGRSTAPLGIAVNYTANPNLLYMGTGIADTPGKPGTYEGTRNLVWPTNRMAITNVAFLTDKSENMLKEFSYSVDIDLQRTVGRVQRMVGL